MYTDHFRLARSPFTPLSNATPPFQSKEFREALAHFEYARRSGEPFFLLVGEVGTGKSTAIEAILDTLDAEIPVAIVTHTTLDARELLEEVLRRFGVNTAGATSKPEILELLELFLERNAAGAPAVLIVDEAHLLSDPALEEIRLLSNLKCAGRSLLQICLVGQPELVDRLRLHRLRPLRQRIAVRYLFGGLDREETREYIRHRLSSAGAVEPNRIFSNGAVNALHELTSGLPREINVVASQAMLNAYLENSPVVQAIHVRTTKRDYGFEGLRPERAGKAEPRPLEKEPRLAPVEAKPPVEVKKGPQPQPRVAPRPRGSDLPLRLDFLGSTELPKTGATWRRGLSAFAIATFCFLALVLALAGLFYPRLSSIEDWIPVPPPSSVRVSPLGDVSLPALPPVDASTTAAPETEPVEEAKADSSLPVLPATTAPGEKADEPRTVSPPHAPPPSTSGEAADLVEYGAHLAGSGRLDDAIAAFRKALSLAPGHSVALYNLGLSLLKNGQAQEAAAALREASAKSPNDGLTHRALGIALRQTGELSAAATALHRAVELSPNDAFALRHLADVLRESGELEEAIELTRRAATLTPNDPILFHELGFTLRLAGRLQEAATAFQRAIDLNRDFALAHYSLGVTLFDLGYRDDAEKEIAEASRLGYAAR